MKRPAGIALDEKDNIFVSEIGNDCIQMFDKDGKPLGMWGSKGSKPGQFGNLHSLLYHQGYLYVADSANDRVHKFKINQPKS